MTRRALVVTTISGPNACLQALAAGAREHDVRFVIAGDTKSPADFALPGAAFLSIDEQTRRFPAMAAVLPTKHYARKNIGYLAAIAAGADDIIETDDDNLPYATFWDPLPDAIEADGIPADPACAWFNAYRPFTRVDIWPRGFPLEYLARDADRTRAGVTRRVRPLLVQGLADGNPDVDAVYRLTRPLPVDFDRRGPIRLEPGAWCPFNSQNTRWRREIFPLLYLPSYCSFRMTDIWRSFVAQRCLWELGEGVVFTAATVRQERNDHDLLRDFADEVPGYLENDRIRRVLEPLALDGRDLVRSVTLCYEAFVRESLIPGTELPIVREWGSCIGTDTFLYQI